MRARGARGLRLALAAYAVAIGIAAAFPGGGLESNPPDKFVHAAAYAVFTLLARAAAVPARGGAAAAVALAVAHGGAVEGLQATLPWRTAEWGDLAADAVGSLAGAAAWGLARRASRGKGIA